MPYYQITEFTAQSRLFRAVMTQYVQLEKLPPDVHPDAKPISMKPGLSTGQLLISDSLVFQSSFFV